MSKKKDMNVNLQSAVDAYKELEDLNDKTGDLSEQLSKAQEQLDSLEKLSKESNLAAENESLKRQLVEAHKTILGYQELNQKLFLRITNPVDEQEPVDEEKVKAEQEAKELEDAINARNTEVEKLNGEEEDEY